MWPSCDGQTCIIECQDTACRPPKHRNSRLGRYTNLRARSWQIEQPCHQGKPPEGFAARCMFIDPYFLIQHVAGARFCQMGCGVMFKTIGFGVGSWSCFACPGLEIVLWGSLQSLHKVDIETLGSSSGCIFPTLKRLKAHCTQVLAPAVG